MNFISRFFHELFNPHCQHCIEERNCKSCEILREQLAIVQAERKYFFELATRKEEIPQQIAGKEPLPIITGGKIPWRVKQQMLESESRQAARVLSEKQNEINESNINSLEKELGINAGAGTK